MELPREEMEVIGQLGYAGTDYAHDFSEPGNDTCGEAGDWDADSATSFPAAEFDVEFDEESRQRVLRNGSDPSRARAR